MVLKKEFLIVLLVFLILITGCEKSGYGIYEDVEDSGVVEAPYPGRKVSGKPPLEPIEIIPGPEPEAPYYPEVPTIPEYPYYPGIPKVPTEPYYPPEVPIVPEYPVPEEPKKPAPVITPRRVPVINGIFSPNEWSDAKCFTLFLYKLKGMRDGLTSGKCIKNDFKYLYIVDRIHDRPNIDNSMAVLFGKGLFSPPDWGVDSENGCFAYIERFKFDYFSYEGIKFARSYKNGVYTFEFKIPLEILEKNKIKIYQSYEAPHGTYASIVEEYVVK